MIYISSNDVLIPAHKPYKYHTDQNCRGLNAARRNGHKIIAMKEPPLDRVLCKLCSLNNH